MSQFHNIAGEEVLWSGSISHWHYAGKWALALLCLAALVYSFVAPESGRFFVHSGLHSYGLTESGLWAARGVLALLAFVLIAWIAIARARRHYVITNKRVGIEIGYFSKDSNEIRIDHIRSINLTTHGLLGLLGVGRLEFSSAATDDAEVVFWNVARAQHVRDLVRSEEKVESN